VHGLILAGGEGSRLAADGLATPKAFIQVGGAPQLLRLVDQLSALGCTNITCMLNAATADWLSASTDPQIAKAARAIRQVARLVPCRTPSSLHTFVAGLQEIPPGPVFATMVDSVMAPNDWTMLHDRAADALGHGADAVLAVTRAGDGDDSPLRVSIDDRGGVVAIGGDAAIPATHVTGGVYAFAPVARTRASAVLASGRHRMRIFLTELVASGAEVRAVDVATIIDIDHRNDLDAANAYMTTLGSPHGAGEGS
jgi:molybdopterin-guanine dinucleotide biosynthesis protein A